MSSSLSVDLKHLQERIQWIRGPVDGVFEDVTSSAPVAVATAGGGPPGSTVCRRDSNPRRVTAFVTEVPASSAQSALKIVNSQSPLGPLLGHLKRFQRSAKRAQQPLESDISASGGEQKGEKKEEPEEIRKLVLLLGPASDGPLRDETKLQDLCAALGLPRGVESVTRQEFAPVDTRYPVQPSVWEECNTLWPCSLPRPRVQDADPVGGADFIFPKVSSGKNKKKQEDGHKEEDACPVPGPVTFQQPGEKFSSIRYWMQQVRALAQSDPHSQGHATLVVDPRVHTVVGTTGQSIIGGVVSSGLGQFDPETTPPSMWPYPRIEVVGRGETSRPPPPATTTTRWPQHATFLALRTMKNDTTGSDKKQDPGTGGSSVGGGDYLCTEMEVYTTVEPCSMCSMALVHSRVKSLFFAQPNPIHGGIMGHARHNSLTTAAGSEGEGKKEEDFVPPLPRTHRLATTNHRFHAYLVPG